MSCLRDFYNGEIGCPTQNWFYSPSTQNFICIKIKIKPKGQTFFFLLQLTLSLLNVSRKNYCENQLRILLTTHNSSQFCVFFYFCFAQEA